MGELRQAAAQQILAPGAVLDEHIREIDVATLTDQDPDLLPPPSSSSSADSPQLRRPRVSDPDAERRSLVMLIRQHRLQAAQRAR